MEWSITKEKKDFKLHLKKPDVILEKWSIRYLYTLNDKEYAISRSLPITALGKRKITCIIDDSRLRISIVLANEEEHIELKCTLDNLIDESIQLDKLEIHIDKVIIPKTHNYYFFKNGYQSWSLTRSYSFSEKEMKSWLSCMNILQDNPRNIPSGKIGSFHSTMFAAIGSEHTAFCVIGQGKPFNQFVYINSSLYNNIPQIAIIYDFGDMVLPASAKLRADLIHFIISKYIHEGFDHYFNIVKLSTSVSKKKVLKGWCSWYYYYTHINEKHIYSNLNYLATKGKRFDIFQIDDGYQKAVGDWLSLNHKFPSGLATISQKIRSLGMIPGIWIAPFIASRKSELFRKHPDWFLRTKNGKPVIAGWNPNWDLFGYFYALDVTNPEFQNYIKEVIHTFVHEWGFGYLKLDFLYAASLHGYAYDMNLTPAQRLKLGYSIIRETAGDKVFILGCGAPLSASIGFVDGMRIGPDVAPYWMAWYRYYLTKDPHALCTKFAIRNTINRSHMNRYFWINDPDCILLRKKETKLTEEERMTLINAVIITGGMYFISDNLTLLSDEDWKKIDTIDTHLQTCSTGRTYVIDLMNKEMPEIVYNTANYIAFFNFSDTSQRKIIQLRGQLKKIISPTTKLEDVWGNRNIYVYPDHIDLNELKPHESILCRIK